MTQLSEEPVLVTGTAHFYYTVSLHRGLTNNNEGQKHTQARPSMDNWKTVSHNSVCIISFVMQTCKTCPERHPQWISHTFTVTDSDLPY